MNSVVYATIIGLLIFFYLKHKKNVLGETWLCRSCLYEGPAKKEIKGHILMEIVLFCCFIFPWVIYAIWRSTNRRLQCPLCKSLELIPSESPMAKKLKGGTI